MKLCKGSGVVLLALCFFSIPAAATAEPQSEEECQSLKNNDKKNLCLAKAPKKIVTGEFGYKSKDHSTYYCSLINDRELQNYCYAIVKGEKWRCKLLVDKKMEEDCNAGQ